ncbi:MAG: hypothetical protein DU429_02520 [Candidatus Tokpelaia sp.]|nr:MAG: hypothetical protein DU430_05270 [Candidatus Tokpelaia sp.]KAA6207355.1 MAG: hypothetical protein DU429_02520 [Candidatus Tokpelaia sp.]
MQTAPGLGALGATKNRRAECANSARVGGFGRNEEQARVSCANSARVGGFGRNKEQARVSRAKRG